MLAIAFMFSAVFAFAILFYQLMTTAAVHVRKMKIGQLAFFELDQAAEHPYGSPEAGSKYQGQNGPTASRFYLNFGAER